MSLKSITLVERKAECLFKIHLEQMIRTQYSIKLDNMQLLKDLLHHLALEALLELLEDLQVKLCPLLLPPESVTHTITFWTNGFTIDDGPLRRFDDPENASFLESIRKSECPKELEPEDRRTSVRVNLTRREEDCPVPEKRRALFQGVGRTLGSSSSSNAEQGDSIGAISSFTAAPTPSVGLVVDESQPSTSIQLRLADGTRMVSRFNYQHTIRDIRGFIDASRPGGSRNYQLQTVGFPPKQLSDLDQTVEQAGLANSVVIQKL